MILGLRNKGYDKNIFHIKKVSVPVISIGNLTLGGTGKTTLSCLAAQILLQENKKVAILSRGYRRKNNSQKSMVVSDGNKIFETPESAGDEPILLAQKLNGVPILVGPDRFKTGAFAIQEFKVDALILDDGFQHRKIHRDLDLVCCDEKILKTLKIFPRGFLREPIQSLKRADFIVLKSENKSEKKVFQETFPFLKNCPNAVFSYEAEEIKDTGSNQTFLPYWLNQKKLFAFSAIANPNHFKKMIENLGGKIIFFKSFPDHHYYNAIELKKMLELAKQNHCLLITTEKDAVKLPVDFPAAILKIKIKWSEGEDEFKKKILGAVH
ncbi:MAG: tetraacyldisaccharide 4'-kinase [Elusimicrobia bacterium]|nr:tetraacyldisaccharide 4'-kinase [Elusimicrobiota bacterium]